MQLDTTAQHVVRVSRMHDDRVVVGHLPLGGEMRAADIDPMIAAVARAKDTEHAVRAALEAALGDLKVEDAESEGAIASAPRPMRLVATRGELLPALPAVTERQIPDLCRVSRQPRIACPGAAGRKRSRGSGRNRL